MKSPLLYLLYASLLCLCTVGTAIGVNTLVFHEGLNTELSAAGGLLLINFGFFVAFSRVHSALARHLGLSFGLLLVTLKLFVNTFTIFLFIGLQAVRTHVFVSQFLAGYTILLVGGIAFLHWNSNR